MKISEKKVVYQETQTYKKIVMKKSKLNTEFIFTWNCTKELFEMSYRNQGIYKNYFTKIIEFLNAMIVMYVCIK